MTWILRARVSGAVQAGGNMEVRESMYYMYLIRIIVSYDAAC